MFYEIPVAKPWTKDKELKAYRDTIEQAKLGDRMGFHSFWTVEHHFGSPDGDVGHAAA